MARLKPAETAESVARGATLSVAWREDGRRGKRRLALVAGQHPSASRFDELARRAIAARFGHLDRRLADSRGPLTPFEVDELEDLERIADDLRSADR